MDDAFVEACAFTVSNAHAPLTLLAFDRRFSLNKGELLSTVACNHLFCLNKSRLLELPQSKMLYSLPASIQSLLKSEDYFEPTIGTARQGMCTFEDARFLRLRWESSPSEIGQGKKWEPLSKGGEFAFYYSDIYLLVLWDGDGREIGEANRRVNGQIAQSRQASEYWRRAGATYSKRSAKGFSVRALPRGCIFGTKGPAILSESTVPIPCLIGWLNSRLIRFLVHVQANAFEFNTGILKTLPWKSDHRLSALCDSTKMAIEHCRAASSSVETNSCFVKLPFGDSLRHTHRRFHIMKMAGESSLSQSMQLWDQTVDVIYGVNSSSVNLEGDDEDQAEDEEDVGDQSISLASTTHSVVSYALGSVMGRWDVRLIHSNRTARIPDPFDPLPACPPGMLQSDEGLPATETPLGYPIRIDWDGLVADDPEHTGDIARRVREVIEMIWKEQADAIETEACEILGVKQLREYFRKPGKGGFWEDHISRYSKSRRKAPIYWLLQSSKKNYALWLYYHRLDKDLLFKSLLNYVEPKIRLETSRLDTLGTQKAAAGESGKEAKRLAKEVERQEEFLSELQDFEDKLRRAANLNLEPDLNDGVVLNIAPLWELVPWKEPKKYWDELLEGKYEWSSIGKQLRAKGLVK
jgi:hypothetical protein